MQNTQKLLITASVAEIKEAFAEVFSETFRKHLDLLSKPKEDTYLTREETRRHLKISLVTLHTWTLQGKLHAHKPTGSSKVYYSEKEVLNLIASSKKTVGYEP
jgi:hypothetical protein